MSDARAVQVVSVTDENYILNESELEAVLLGAAADRPVAVLSVAGAYRGGKSFLLDLLMRYLRADDDKRSSGAWLTMDGATSALSGFHWRGGSRRDTTGVWLWSQPYEVSLPSGQPMLIFLMDTQGTFDWQSRVRDCSTVFALSSLLSSIQIYNLSKDVRTDDLHHLELFAKYGMLASQGGEEVPFQTLMFLVRDWSYPSDFPFGAEGGRRLLEQRLQDENRTPEIDKLWTQIRAIYEQVSCFLMAHPGLRVYHDDFEGQLNEIEQDFKTCISELAPAVLGTGNIRPKTVRGGMMTGRDLFHYFQSYLEVFNSDDTPEPMTIFQATAKAGLQSGAAAVRAHYRNAMQELCREGAPSMTSAQLLAAHQQERSQALAIISSARMMANADDVAQTLVELEQELDSELERYTLMNGANFRRALETAQGKYEEKFLAISPIEELCLHPADLEPIHLEAADAAKSYFSQNRVQSDSGEEDEDLAQLDRWIADRYRTINERNVSNNNAAVAYAFDVYKISMNQLTELPCVAVDLLNRIHDEARLEAISRFNSRRSKQTECQQDEYKSRLNEDIANHIQHLRALNERNNDFAVSEAIAEFNRIMMELCVTSELCLHHPHQIRTEFEKAMQAALDLFRSKRTRNENGRDDTYTEKIVTEATDRYTVVYVEINRRKNEQAVETAMIRFHRIMGEESSAQSMLGMIAPMSIIGYVRRSRRGELEAFAAFRDLRRPPPPHMIYNDDDFKDSLKLAIDKAKKQYKSKALIQDMAIVASWANHVRRLAGNQLETLSRNSDIISAPEPMPVPFPRTGPPPPLRPPPHAHDLMERAIQGAMTGWFGEPVVWSTRGPL